MKIKAGRIPTVYAVISKLINEKRPLPSKGKYRIGRLFDTLGKEAERFEKDRSELVKKYGVEMFAKNEDGGDKLDADGKKVSVGWQVPPEKLAEFQAEFLPIVEMEIEVACQPIPLSQLDAPALVEVTADDGSKKMVEPITAEEFILLGDLVVDDDQSEKIKLL